MGGLLLDPLGEIGDVGLRWRREVWPREPEPDAPEMREYLAALVEMDIGSALIVDEAGRFLRNDPAYTRRPLFQALDIARNRGISWAIAEKRPTRLPSEVTDLADRIVWRPWMSGRAKAWLIDAGLDPDALPLPIGHWYVARVGGEPDGRATTSEIARSFAAFPSSVSRS